MNRLGERPELGELLARLREGCPTAESELYELIYDDLREQARATLARLGPGDSLLQPTAVVSEAYLRLRAGQWKDSHHFAAVCGRAMRSVILDHFRRRNAANRAPRARVLLHELIDRIPSKPPELDGDQISLIDDACRVLAARSPEAAKIIDVRFFTGLTVPQMATLYDIPVRTMESRLSAAKAMLKRIAVTLEKEQR